MNQTFSPSTMISEVVFNVKLAYKLAMDDQMLQQDGGGG
jgi:hypothetical protein